MKFERRDSGAEEPQIQQETKTQSPESMKKRQTAVFVYMALLFLVALGLVVLSYFVQQSRNRDQISDITEQHSEFSSQALRNIEELQKTNLALKDELEDKTLAIQELEDEVEDLNEEIVKLREQWAEDVKTVEGTLKTDYNNAVHRSMGIEAIYNLKKAIENGDKELADQYIQQAEGAKEFLDSSWITELNELKMQAELIGTQAEPVDGEEPAPEQ